ncbi:hypothetical protein N4P33_34955, partial [Streptomyces sp. 15-116A]|nr:hypothetical protein [Streptomyces sp. 15-116A]
AGSPAGRPPAAPDAPKTSDRPAGAQDTEAHCRAYEQVAGRGKALDATAWQRLTEAAGGEENIDAYCAGRTRDGNKAADPARTAKGAPGSDQKKGTGGKDGDRGAPGRPEGRNKTP